jgi:hypothetical protein
VQDARMLVLAVTVALALFIDDVRRSGTARG